jgi:hypothetical protein
LAGLLQPPPAFGEDVLLAAEELGFGGHIA